MAIKKLVFAPGFMTGASLFRSENSAPASQKIKVSELPLYDEPAPVENQAYFVATTPTPFLEEKVAELRHATADLFGGAERVRERVRDTYDIGKAHSQNALEIVRDESRGLPRAIFISSGALLGLLIASRRGFIRKILYTSIGAGVPAAICYPQASKELIKAGYAYTKDLASSANSYANQTLNKNKNEPVQSSVGKLDSTPKQ